MSFRFAFSDNCTELTCHPCSLQSQSRSSGTADQVAIRKLQSLVQGKSVSWSFPPGRKKWKRKKKRHCCPEWKTWCFNGWTWLLERHLITAYLRKAQARDLAQQLMHLPGKCKGCEFDKTKQTNKKHLRKDAERGRVCLPHERSKKTCPSVFAAINLTVLWYSGNGKAKYDFFFIRVHLNFLGANASVCPFQWTVTVWLEKLVPEEDKIISVSNCSFMLQFAWLNSWHSDNNSM